MKISVVIPSYERPKLLNRLLLSIIEQSYRPYEIIVVDDNSKSISEIEMVVENFRSLFKQITLIKNATNQGACFSRNQGILKAEADWIALVDDDDEWMPSKLEVQCDSLKNMPHDLGLVYTWTNVVKNGQLIDTMTPLHEGYVLKNILQENFIPSPSVLVRKEAVLKAGLFDTTMPSCQDWDMWIRILEKGYTCSVIKSELCIYHKHDQPTIGMSPRALEGYRKINHKHKHLYKRYFPFSYYKACLKNMLKSPF